MNIVSRNKVFFISCIGKILSIMGDHFNDIALMWYILSVKNNPQVAALSLTLSYLTGVFLSFLGGIFVDRFSSISQILVCNFLNFLISFLLFFFMYNDFDIYFLIGLNFLLSCFDALYKPAAFVLTQEVVSKDDLMRCNSFSEVLLKVMTILSPLLAGFLCSLIDSYFLIFLNSVSFLISFAIHLRIKGIFNFKYKSEKGTDSSKKLKIWDDIKDSYYCIINNMELKYIMILGGVVINFAMSPLSLYIPYYVNNVLREDSSYYGLLSAVLSAGALFSAILISSSFIRLEVKKICILGFFLQSFSFLIFSFAQNIFIAVFSFLILGFASSLINISLVTTLQEKVSQKMLGKIGGLMASISSIITPLSMFIVSIFIEKIEFSYLILISFFLIFISSIIIYFIFRRESESFSTEEQCFSESEL